MSNYDFLKPRERKKSLFIVEGEHEKDVLFKLLLRAFPEIDIREEDIIIFGTNIYLLYAMIVKEYEEDWDEGDVDLPYLVSKERGYEALLSKDDFNNIVLVFDYERHDPGFSEEKICRMQRFFSDVTDVGKLFLNYPMIESYQHFTGWPDERFENTVCPANIQRGKEYKSEIRNTMIARLVGTPMKLDKILAGKFHVQDEGVRADCIEHILLLQEAAGVEGEIEKILSEAISGAELQTAKYLVADVVRKAGYCEERCTYYEYMRAVFKAIIKQNICKAGKIVGKEYRVPKELLRDAFEQIDFSAVLDAENEASRDAENGSIQVLNTSVLVVPDYRFALIEE